jgi:predicted CopG family antitoxin
MAVKSITIDLEAYDRLKSVKKADESFSQVIKRVVRKPLNSGRLLRKLRALDEKTMEAVEEQLSGRSRKKREPANAVS